MINKINQDKIKTEEEWLKIYHEFWDMLKGNHVRLVLGQFSDDDRWAYINLVGYPSHYDGFMAKELKKILDVCDKYNLYISFDRYGEIKIWENKK